MVVLVAGASRGIGWATVEALLQVQDPIVSVYGVSRSRPLKMDDLPASQRDRFHFESLDLSQESFGTKASGLIERTLDRFGRLDVVIYNTGTVQPLTRLEQLNLQDLDLAFQVNVKSMISLIQAALPQLKQNGGKVLGVSSGAAQNGRPGWGPYCMSKAAMNLLFEAWACEEPEVTFITLRPGVVDTEMQKEIRDQGKQAMGEKEHLYFVDKHIKGDLLDPRVPADRLAQLSLRAPRDWSGKFITNTEPLLPY